MQRLLAFRDRGRPTGSTTSTSAPCRRDPIGEVRALYEWLGEPVTAEFEAGMRGGRSHAEHREANVHPDPATFGLDLDDVRPPVRRVHAAHEGVDRSMSRTPSRVDAERVQQFEGVVPQPPRGVRVGDARVPAAPRMRVGAHGQRLGAVFEHQATRGPRAPACAATAHSVVAAACAGVLRIGFRLPSGRMKPIRRLSSSPWNRCSPVNADPGSTALAKIPSELHRRVVFLREQVALLDRVRQARDVVARLPLEIVEADRRARPCGRRS